MNKIIDEITNTTFARYGNKTIFREYEFKPITVGKTTAFYRVQSAINFPYIYEIQLHVFDKVTTYKSFIKPLHKCMYCNKKNPNYKMRCCNQYTHFDCGVKNKFACCHLAIYLVSAYRDECVVCLEETNTVTECGHHLCVNCLTEMYKKSEHKDNKITCPMCRDVIVQETNITDYKNVQINNREEVVCISII